MLTTVQTYLYFALGLSLVITAIHYCFLSGNILGWIRSWIATQGDKICRTKTDCGVRTVSGPCTESGEWGETDKQKAQEDAKKQQEKVHDGNNRRLKIWKFIQKPIWDCLPCMAGLWTVILTQRFDPSLILLVVGINILFNAVLDYD